MVDFTQGADGLWHGQVACGQCSRAGIFVHLNWKPEDVDLKDIICWECHEGGKMVGKCGRCGEPVLKKTSYVIHTPKLFCEKCKTALQNKCSECGGYSGGWIVRAPNLVLYCQAHCPEHYWDRDYEIDPFCVRCGQDKFDYLQTLLRNHNIKFDETQAYDIYKNE